MKYSKSIVSTIAAIVAITTIAAGLTACAPGNDAEGVTPLRAGQASEQRVVKTELFNSLAPAVDFDRFSKFLDDRSFHTDLAFFETVMSYGPVSDPRNIFLMANAYLVANQQAEGIAFMERVFKRYENTMNAGVRASYLAAYAILRATYAEQVPIPGRIWWVLDTFDLLDEAKALSKGENPLVHWAAGLIYAQVPWFFGKQEEALTELLWLAAHPETEPLSGFYREVYHHLAIIYADRGDGDLAAKYQRKSGYDSYVPKTLFMGWLTTTKEKGVTFSATPWIEEIVPNRLFAVRGFGFSEMHFVVTEDGKQLVAIDAGTQPFSMEAAYRFLVQQQAGLPPLTTAFVTHAHWDHIGGYSYLKKRNPDLKLYGRGNYGGTLNRVQRNHKYQQFRGINFDDAWVKDYRPDVVVDREQTVTIGGTVFEMIPVTGGETEDAMLINIAALEAIFVGDTMMPYYGEPWVEEGFIDGALATMDDIISRNPKHVLHGHYGLTFMYGAKEIAVFRGAYAWLVDATRKHLSNGYSIGDILRLNLIPPGLQNHPEAFLGYLAPRDHIIARVADHMLGIWQEDVSGQEPRGLDSISSVEYGRLLARYLGLSAGEVADALGEMLAAGDNELALQFAVAAEKRYGDNEEIIGLKEEAADRLRSAAQFFDPFKFVVYTEMIGKEHKPIPAMPVE